MRNRARLISVLLGVAACCVLLAGGAFGDPLLLSVNATYLDTDFTATGGTYGNGVLSIEDEADIVVEYDIGQVTYDNGSFALTTSLFADNSLGGLASGLFQGGSMTVQDGDEDDLLLGAVISLQLDEVPNQPGLLAGCGRFSVTGGSLAGDFGAHYGDVVEIAFLISPPGISDFSTDFSGMSNVTLVPVAEPGTLALVGSTVLVLLRRRRRR